MRNAKLSTSLTEAIDLPPPLSQKSAKKRADLLGAALRIIPRDGHHQLTRRRVAEEAKSSHGAVLYYYGSRTALMCAAMEYSSAYHIETSAKIIPELEKAADRPKRSAEILISNHSTAMAVFDLNMAAAREDYLRPVLYK